jgi:hypothetical protein
MTTSVVSENQEWISLMGIFANLKQKLFCYMCSVILFRFRLHAVLNEYLDNRDLRLYSEKPYTHH